MHADRMRLHNSRTSIHIDNQTRKSIPLSVNETERIGLRISEKPYRASDFQRYLQTMLPKRCVNRLFLIKRKYANCNAPNLDMPFGKKCTFSRYHIHQITLIGLPFNVMNSTAVHPRMETPKRVLLPFFQNNNFIIH